MMHDRAAELGKDGKGTGKYHMVSGNRRVGTFAIGYCDASCSHDTAQSAMDHQRQYILDHLRPLQINRATKHLCEVEGCEEWTQTGLQSSDGWSFVLLCDAHCNAETYGEHFLPVGSHIESWHS